MRTNERNCSGCRYWSEMVAMVDQGVLKALCLGPADKTEQSGRYTAEAVTCPAWALNTLGAVDDPPDYGEAVRAGYADQAAMKHPNGAPKFAPDGTLLDDNGNRSIFDDVDVDDDAF